MTALQFLTSFRSAEIHFVGTHNGICWMDATVDVDGTEPQRLFVMEHRGTTRAAWNLSAVQHHQAIENPSTYWFQAGLVEV